MPLTLAQLQALKADIVAASDAECVTLEADPTNADKAFAVKDLYNLLATPAFVVWRTNVSTAEIRSVLVWAEYDGLSVSKQNAFTFLCSNHIVNAGLPNVRQGIQSIFAGAQQQANRDALTALAKRSATRAEKLFATGTGSDASPATLSFEGNLTFQDVLLAMAS